MFIFSTKKKSLQGGANLKPPLFKKKRKKKKEGRLFSSSQWFKSFNWASSSNDPMGGKTGVIYRHHKITQKKQAILKLKGSRRSSWDIFVTITHLMWREQQRLDYFTKRLLRKNIFPILVLPRLRLRLLTWRPGACVCGAPWLK